MSSTTSTTAKATSTTNTKMNSEKIVKTVNILRCKIVNIDKLQELLGHSIIILRGLICEPDQITALTGRRRGRCKWFNVAKGWGFITPNDGGPDVFVHQSVIQMNGFRSLGDEEEVEFECKVSDKGLEATLVTGVEGLECKGSHRRPISRKKFKKVRCYNCGEFANHIAAKCNMGPQPKKCHHCKAVDHLIADCPVKDDKPKTKKSKQLQPSVSSDGEDEQIEDESHDNSEDKLEVKCENKVENKCLNGLQDNISESETINESTSLKATASLTRPTSSCCSPVKEEPTGSTELTECVTGSTLNSTCLTQSETSMLTLSLPIPEPCESSEVNDDCCVIIMNNKLNVETSEMGSEDDVSLVTVETQSTSSSVSSDHGKEVRSDSGIIDRDDRDDRDDDCMNGRSNSRNSCDINNNNNNDSNNDESKNIDINDTDHSKGIMDSKIIANNIKNVENCNNSFNNNNNNLNLNNKLFSSVESITTGNNLLNTESDKHSISSSLIQLPQPESS